MIKRLIIRNEHLKELKRVADSSLPFESCALLSGIIKNYDAIIEEIRPLRNIANSDIMFVIDPDEFYNIYKEVRSKGREVVCIFHSHSSKPRPSQTDLRYMMINQIPWLIMSNINYEIDVYAYYNDLKRLELVIED